MILLHFHALSRFRMMGNKLRGLTIIYASLEGLVDRKELCWLQIFEIVEARRRMNVNTILLDV